MLCVCNHLCDHFQLFSMTANVTLVSNTTLLMGYWCRQSLIRNMVADLSADKGGEHIGGCQKYQGAGRGAIRQKKGRWEGGGERERERERERCMCVCVGLCI